MKKLVIIAAIVVSFWQVRAQTADDALRYSQNFYEGSARNMAMGSAFSVLGADFSAASINPAGLGLYRRNDFSISPELNFRGSKSIYNGMFGSDNRTVFNLSNLAVVMSKKVYSARKSDWKYYQISFGMNRLNNFNVNLNMVGPNYQNSKMDVYLEYANGIPYTDIKNDANGDYAFDLKPAWDLYLLDTIPNTVDEYYSPVPPGGILQRQQIQSSGSINEWTFSISGNYSDFLFLGATLGMPHIRYFGKSVYTETDVADTIPYFNSWSYTQNLQTTGWGINLKLGIIVRPFEWLRIGAAFHTPTYYYSLQDIWSTETYADLPGFGPKSASSPTGNFNYALTTPLKAIGSVGVTILKQGALSFEYEFVDYRNAKFSAAGTDYSSTNNDIRKYYGSTVNIRGGVEWRFGPLSLRGGYAFYGSPYVNNTNDASRRNISGGVGFSTGNFAIDFAYVHSSWKDNYYFYSSKNVSVNPAKNSFTNNSFVLTLKSTF